MNVQKEVSYLLFWSKEVEDDRFVQWSFIRIYGR